MEIYDSLVIGAGPAGITAAIYLKRANLNVAIIEKETPGGQINKTSSIENYPGIKQITGPELAYQLYEQLNEYKIPYIYGEVLEIQEEDNIKIVKLKDKELKAKKIIIAVGKTARKLPAKNEESLEGKGISFCSLCDGHLYKDEDVAIVGGGNSALEESLYLSDICKSVTILYRKENLRGDKILVEKIKQKENINILYNTEIKEFIGKDEKLEKLIITENKEEKELKVKACFIFIGYEPATKFLKNLDILNEKGYIITDEKKETKIKGIFAAGDIVEKEAYQIITAASDGAIAATSLIKELSLEE